MDTAESRGREAFPFTGVNGEGTFFAWGLEWDLEVPVEYARKVYPYLTERP